MSLPSIWRLFEEDHAELLPRLYPYEPAHLLLRHELDELFDTTPDLTGVDIDISRFIRSGEERDLHVFWADIAPKTDPLPDLKPIRETLCPVPFLKARDWLCGKESSTTKAPHLKPDKRAWIWNWLDGQWCLRSDKTSTQGRQYWLPPTVVGTTQNEDGTPIPKWPMRLKTARI